MTAKYIYVVRHAWAHEFGDPRWPDDSLRELEPEGAERFMKMVETLSDRGFEPTAIATSPYTRCRQTADLISQYTIHRPEVTELDALCPSSDINALIQWSREVGCEQLCWIGHAPDVGLLTAALVGDQHAEIRFAKGAIAAVRLYKKPGIGCGELYWHATAKSLGL